MAGAYTLAKAQSAGRPPTSTVEPPPSRAPIYAAVAVAFALASVLMVVLSRQNVGNRTSQPPTEITTTLSVPLASLPPLQVNTAAVTASSIAGQVVPQTLPVAASTRPPPPAIVHAIPAPAANAAASHAPDDIGGDTRAPDPCFSQGQVQSVIGMHQLAIRRSCWERDPTPKPEINVSVSMTIGTDGSTQNVAASGDESSVAQCVENDVRGWHFPAMGCAQKTRFSFKFVRQ